MHEPASGLPLGGRPDARPRRPAVESARVLARDAARVDGGLGRIERRASHGARDEPRSQEVDGDFSR